MTQDRAALEVSQIRVRILVQQLECLRLALHELEEKIAECFQQYPDRCGSGRLCANEKPASVLNL